MKKVGVNAACNHDEDEECTDDCLTASVISYISPEELNTFYSELDTDSYYELQVETSLDGCSNRCRGFISTYPGGENLGIFTQEKKSLEKALKQLETELDEYKNNTSKKLQWIERFKAFENTKYRQSKRHCICRRF